MLAGLWGYSLPDPVALLHSLLFQTHTHTHKIAKQPSFQLTDDLALLGHFLVSKTCWGDVGLLGWGSNILGMPWKLWRHWPLFSKAHYNCNLITLIATLASMDYCLLPLYMYYIHSMNFQPYAKLINTYSPRNSLVWLEILLTGDLGIA